MKHVTDLFDLTFFKLVKLMHHGIQRQRLVCATSFCVLKWFFCLSHSSCLACKKMGVITAWWGVCSRSWYPFIDRVQVYKTGETIPTLTVLYFWLDCCYTLWLCFTTWICVFYVLTSGCLYSVLFVIITPMCMPLCISSEQLKISKTRTHTY